MSEPIAPAPTPPPVEWECKLTTEQGSPPAEATVGTKLLLKCAGPTVPDWKASPQLKFPVPEQEFSLAIIQAKKSTVNDGEWIVAGYKPGQHKPEWIDITDGTTTVRARNLEWTLGSVIEKKQGEKTEPYPAIGPIFLFWPMWVWISLGVVVLLIATLIYRRVKKQKARKALLARLAAKGTILTPYAEFHKTLRQLTRQHPDKPEEYVKQLDDSFRYFLTREFVVPADEWPISTVLKDLKKRHKSLFKSVGPDLSSLLREFKRATASAKVSLNDAEQLQELSRKVVDRIHAEKGARP